MTDQQIEWIEYLVGKTKRQQLTHQENITRVENDANFGREHNLIALGYNMALLEMYPNPLPITHDDGVVLTREHLERVVADLKEMLGYANT